MLRSAEKFGDEGALTLNAFADNASTILEVVLPFISGLTD